MSLVPPTESPELGPLSISEVYFEHDGPRLFLATTPSDHLFLANCVDEDEESDTYLYLPISRSRLDLVRSGGISLRDAFLNAEDGMVHQVVADYGATPAINRINPLPTHQISEDWLPLPDAFLDIPTETQPSFNPQVFSLDSAREFRTRVALEVSPPNTLRTEYSLRSLSRLTGSFQDTLDALAQEDRGRPTARGVIPDEILQESELVFSGALAASFVLVLAPKSKNSLFGNELVNNSTQRLLELLQAAQGEGDLSSTVNQYGNRARSKFRNLLAVLSDDETGASIFLSTNEGGLKSAKIELDSVRRALITIDDRSPDSHKHQLERVTLVGVNLRTGIFELFDNIGGQRYSGQMSPEAKSDISGLPTGEEHFYSATILETMEYSTMTSDVSRSYRLMSIRAIDQLVT